MEKLYQMELHEVVHLDTKDPPTMVVRVPGGWVYRFYQGFEEPHLEARDGWNTNYLVDSIFVPFDNEFQAG